MSALSTCALCKTSTRTFWWQAHHIRVCVLCLLTHGPAR